MPNSIMTRVARASALGVLLFALMAGCAPAARYASGQEADRPASPPIAVAAQQDGNAAADSRPDGTDESSIPPVALRNDAGKKPPAPPAKAPSAALPQNVKRRSLQHLEHVVKSYIGTKYKYGGMSRSGVDCSGFVSLVFHEVYGMSLPRSAKAMWLTGVPVPVAVARPGDLVFFKGGSFSTIDHVGIYMGNNVFAHASTSAGVRYSNLKDTYYARRLAGVKRVL